MLYHAMKGQYQTTNRAGGFDLILIMLYVTMEASCCANCPNKDKCKSKIHPNVANVIISSKSIQRAKATENMQTEI